MIVSLALYESLRGHVESCIRNHLPVTVDDAFKLEVPFDSLSSLYSQISLRSGHQSSHHGDFIREESFRRIEEGQESFTNLARQHSKGTYTLAKNFLEYKFGKDFKVATFLENPSLVQSKPVRCDLLRMIADDFNNSIEANLIKESTGKDYEELLIEMLNLRRMCFETEEESRAKGKPKTPDILFLVPMATAKSRYDPTDFFSAQQAHSLASSVGEVFPNPPNLGLKRSPTKRSVSIQFQPDDYLVINWIDSKAMFADKKTFQDHLIQLESYRNRYGRGMVIYWHGVVEDVYSMLTDDMIVVRDSFPDEWIFPTGEPADGRIPVFDEENPQWL